MLGIISTVITNSIMDSENLVQTISRGLNHPEVRWAIPYLFTKHITLYKGEGGSVNISLWLFILVGTKAAAASVWTEEASIRTDAPLGPTSRASSTTGGACLSSTASRLLPSASLPPPSPRSKSAAETHSGCAMCCHLSILATDFDEMTHH